VTPGRITPVQSLSLMNSPFMKQCAERFESRIESEPAADPTEIVDRAYLLAMARKPSAEERSLAQVFIQKHGLKQFCLVLFNTNEFLFIN
jgi:hypothetical protein